MVPFDYIRKLYKNKETPMKRYLALTGLVLTLGALAAAQDSGQRIVVPARNSSRPRLLKVNSLNSPITIKTHSGREVIVEVSGSTGRRERDRERERAPEGMRRIDIPFGGFNVEEEDNVITV